MFYEYRVLLFMIVLKKNVAQIRFFKRNYVQWTKMLSLKVNSSIHWMDSSCLSKKMKI